MPGFITHQTSRGDDTGDMPQTKTDKGVMLQPFRQRDWDHLGWRYSLLSSIAVAGWNNVIDLIPGRDAAEDNAFGETDRRWFRKWIDWTAEHKEYLRNTRTILGQPAIGKVDGTAAFRDNRGYVFLFNPNGRRLEAEVTLDDTLGFKVPPGAAKSLYVVRELYPVEGRLIGKPGGGLWSAGRPDHGVDGWHVRDGVSRSSRCLLRPPCRCCSMCRAQSRSAATR